MILGLTPLPSGSDAADPSAWFGSRQETPDEPARLLGRFVASVGEGGQQESSEVRVGASRLAHVGEPFGEQLGGRRLAPYGPLHQAESEASELPIRAHRESMAVRLRVFGRGPTRHCQLTRQPLPLSVG